MLRRLLAPAALALALAPSAAAAVRPDGSLLVVLDPGHGGEKDGAIGPGKIREKDVALQIARKVQAALAAAGHEALLTRASDASLKLGPRVKLANERGADLFLSIHLNSMPTSRKRARVHGLETYFLSADATDEQAALLAAHENKDDEDAGAERPVGAVAGILADLARTETHADSSRLAYMLHARILEGTGAKDRGVRQAPFFVLEGAAMPAVLIETGYISHPEESKRLSSPEEQEKIAKAIVTAVEDFRREVLGKRERPGLPVAASRSPSAPSPAPAEALSSEAGPPAP